MATITSVCAYCGKVLKTQEDPHYDKQVTSHGLCSDCVEVLNKEIDEMIKKGIDNP